MDPQVLIDALAVIMGHEEKELCKPGHLALVLIHETASTILGSKEKVNIILDRIISQNIKNTFVLRIKRGTQRVIVL